MRLNSAQLLAAARSATPAPPAGGDTAETAEERARFFLRCTVAASPVHVAADVRQAGQLVALLKHAELRQSHAAAALARARLQLRLPSAAAHAEYAARAEGDALETVPVG